MHQRFIPHFHKQPISASAAVAMLRLSFAIGALLTTIVAMSTAQAASCKLPKSYYKNVSCTTKSGYFLAVKDFGAPVALIDSSGKKLVDLTRYQKVDIDKIASGLLPVLRNSHVGYVDMQGREVVPTIYDMLSGGQGWARPVSDGRIVVKRGGQYGVISTSNQIIVPFSSAISDIDNYRGGMARVSKNKVISWLDKNGNPASNPNGSSRDKSAPAATNNAKKTVSNSTAKDNVSSSNQQPPSAPFTTLQPQQQDGRWGFVDEQNVIMITYSFDEVRPFSEGLAGVRIKDNWGFLSLGGELVIPFQFDNFLPDTLQADSVTSESNSATISEGDDSQGMLAFVFKDGKAWVGNLKDGSKICINKEGEIVSCQ